MTDELVDVLLELRGLAARAVPHLPDALVGDYEFDTLTLMGRVARLAGDDGTALGRALLAWEQRGSRR